MNLFNKKRNKDEYLKYNNGRIESLGKKDSIPKDYRQIAYEKELKDGFIENELMAKYQVDLDDKDNDSNNKDINNKNFSNILVKIGVTIILVPILFLGYKAFSSYKINLNETINKEEPTTNNNSQNDKLNEENTNVDYNNTINEPVINEEQVTTDISITKLTSLLTQIENINTNLYNAYEATKTDIINYTNGANGANATTENLKARKNRVLKNKQSIQNISTDFEDLGLEDVQKNILRRYDNLSSGIDQLLLDMSKSRVVSMLNNKILDENSYLDKQEELIRNYLTNNNIKFIEKEGKFTIE